MPGIGDYALIGDCRSAALVSRGGSIDWLCWPRFDSSSIFGRLLDPKAGHWRLSPSGNFRSERTYLPGTNVLETRFVTGTGVVSLTDLMPVAGEREKRSLLEPEHELLRVAVCEKGSVDLECDLAIRADYGARPARARVCASLGVRFETGPGTAIWLRSDAPLAAVEGGATGRVRLRAGERACFSLVYASDGPAVLPELGEPSLRAIERSAQEWRRWSGRLSYAGPYREAVLRSALVLKLLSYSPSGALIAAPTTSLPERAGGDLNWDYRYCWLRDASLTAEALFGLGYTEEAQGWISWLLNATKLTQPRLRVLYDVFGNRPQPERSLPLAGWGGARPVRVGNMALEQKQLDVYGEVVHAATQFVERGGRFNRDSRRLLCSIGEHVLEHWEEADAGLWERRSRDRQNTHSKLLCWTALDRLSLLQSEGKLCEERGERFAAGRERIADAIRRRAWNERRQAYVDEFDGTELDASVLAMSWLGFERADSPRMRATYEALRGELGSGPLLYRYRDGDSPGEGAFGVCGFWAVRYLAVGGGSYQEAAGAFERILPYGNDVGLFAEETEPSSGEPLGNFPQAFTHIGLITAALALEERAGRDGALPGPGGAQKGSPALREA
ncbi:MAG: glycoside hydrolase family 15 protein [Elusimicrobia bacterium]|nr:glycoside hydrolase family 15 protein [Elusimicrobiota bacterium]